MSHPISLAPHERLDEVNDDLKLIQSKDGLTFGTDAYLLAAYMSEMRVDTAVELGGGTGIISLLTATHERAKRHQSCTCPHNGQWSVQFAPVGTDRPC